jgi:catechol 2,3-dioxygenase-like lactoylglutathione lyase family enzyme
MLKTRGIAHFTLPVTDLQRSIAFYRDVLGLTLVQSVAGLAFFRTGKDHLVLAETPDAGKQPSAKPTSREVHQAFIVESPDFDASVTFLASKDIDVVYRDERPDGAVFAGRSVYFYDPDGNMLELIDLASTYFRPKDI